MAEGCGFENVLSGRERNFEKVLITNRFSVSIDIKIISVLSNCSLLIFGESVEEYTRRCTQVVEGSALEKR